MCLKCPPLHSMSVRDFIVPKGKLGWLGSASFAELVGAAKVKSPDLLSIGEFALLNFEKWWLAKGSS